MSKPESPSYIDVLAALNIGAAHPGGKALTKKLWEEESVKPADRILDAGCGTGESSVWLYETFKCHIDGVDCHAGMAEIAKERARELPQVTISWSSIEQLPYKPESYEYVLSESVLTFTNIEASLKNLHRVLKLNGRLMLNELCLIHPVTDEEKKLIKNVYGFTCLPAASEWIKILSQADFTHIDVLDTKDVHTLQTSMELDDISIPPGTEPEHLNMLENHQKLLETFKEKLGYILIRCDKRT